MLLCYKPNKIIVFYKKGCVIIKWALISMYIFGILATTIIRHLNGCRIAAIKQNSGAAIQSQQDTIVLSCIDADIYTSVWLFS